MKKKLFTILTLLVLCVTGAWASTEVINAGRWSSNALYLGTCVYTSSVSGAGDGQFSAGDGGGNIQGYSPSNKGIKLRTQRTTVTVSDTEYGIVLFSVRSGYKVNSITIEGTSNGSNTITLKGVYADVNTASLATSLAGATNILTTDKTYPSNSTNYITSGTLSVNAEDNIVLLFNKDTDNQLRAIITFDYDLSGVAAPTVTLSGNTVALASATADADIYYTTDGSTPTSSSNAYSEPFTLDNPSTVRAIAIKDDEASDVTDEDCYFTPTDAMALLKFTSGAVDGEDAYLWTSTDGDYALKDNNNEQTNKYTSLEAANDAFKLSHVDGYTLTPSADIKITKIAFIGKSLYEGYTGTVKVTGFNSNAASSFIEYPTDGQKYLSTIEFTPDAELTYGAAVNFNPGGCESAAYIVIYGVKRSGPADPETGVNVTETITFNSEGKVSSVEPNTYSSIVTVANVKSSTWGDYTHYLYMDSSGSLTIAIPSNASNVNVEILSSNEITSLKLNSSSKTSVSGTGNSTDGYTYSIDIDDSNAGSNYVIQKGDGSGKFYKITLTYMIGEANQIKLTTTDNMAGWRAFYDAENEYSVDANTKVYVADADPVGTTITLKEISGIPDGVPVILHTSSNADNYKMTLTKATAGTYTYSGTNNLEYTTNIVSNVYRLGYGDEGIGFYPYSGTPTSGAVILNVSSASARALNIVFEDESTGIAATVADKNVKSNEVFNLAGQRVAQPTKGLYIINGKKVVLK